MTSSTVRPISIMRPASAPAAIRGSERRFNCQEESYRGREIFNHRQIKKADSCEQADRLPANVLPMRQMPQ